MHLAVVRMDVTLWAAKHLMLFDAILAALVVATLLYHRRHSIVVWWSIVASSMLVASLGLARFASLFYTDPRPFAQEHYQPLLPHTANNGFPSGYATLAAAIVFAVLLLSRRWAIPFLLLAIMIDWARVGVGLHHVIDIVAAWAFVAVAGSIVFMPATVAACILIPHLPPALTAERFRLRERFDASATA
jgi:membrane-associated phospholipid phosphatase